MGPDHGPEPEGGGGVMGLGRWRNLEHGHGKDSHSCPHWRSEHGYEGRCLINDRQKHHSCSYCFDKRTCGSYSAYQRGLRDAQNGVKPSPEWEPKEVEPHGQG